MENSMAAGRQADYDMHGSTFITMVNAKPMMKAPGRSWMKVLSASLKKNVSTRAFLPPKVGVGGFLIIINIQNYGVFCFMLV